MQRTAGSIAGVMVLAAFSGLATAYDAGDFILRAGSATVAPNPDSGHLYVNGAVTTLVPGQDLIDISTNTQLGISGTYMFNAYIGLELLAATPFEHDLSAQGDLAAAGVGDIGTTSHLPPTLTVQWYPMGQNSAWQPYVGLGVNYTWFYDEQLDDSFVAALGSSDKDFTLSDSIGPAALIGLDWLFTQHLLLNVSVMYADISTKAKINNTALGDLKIDVDVDPWVYRVNLGYRF